MSKPSPVASVCPSTVISHLANFLDKSLPLSTLLPLPLLPTPPTMGLFDESDSDNDAANNNTGGDKANAGGYDDDEEEEDPLDAYMSSLATTKIDNAGAGGGGGRLDVDAEDEATSHWEVAGVGPARGSTCTSKLLLEEYDANKAPAATSATAKTSWEKSAAEAQYGMSNTFVRAGTGLGEGGVGKKKLDAHNDAVADDEADTDDDDNMDITKLRNAKEEQHLQMLHQEVDPLERIDHKSIQYGAFERVFYHPTNTPAGHAWRKEHDVVCSPPNFDPILGFGELGGGSGSVSGEDGGRESSTAVFPEELLRAIAQSGYDSPTLVQSQTLSVALSGHDALITASTGSGKTLAYIWPMIVHINDQPHIQPGIDGPIGVVLTPTRELAKQVYKYAKTFIECIGGKAVEVSGGNRGTWELTKVLKLGCEIVVGSPGRLIDMVKKKGTNLRRVTFLVLDEADKMLDMGFEKQVNSILENIRPDRQTLLLSATFGKRVEKVARSWLRNPVRVAIGQTGAASEHVDSQVMVLPSHSAKVQWLMEMIPILVPLGRCLIFVATRAECDNLSSLIQSSSSLSDGEDGASTTIVSIHGDKDQRDRNLAISQFKKNSRSILIATDVASRGLDVPNVAVVVNFDAAKNMDAHVHRVGRAGRLRKESSDCSGGGQFQRGVAYTLLTEKNANFAASLADAFDREGREVSQELAALCNKSNRFGSGRVKNSKVGLGFSEESAGTSHYGPSASDQPARKRNRWD